jgi:hypothetical protein
MGKQQNSSKSGENSEKWQICRCRIYQLENNTVLKTERKLSWHEQERFNVSKTLHVCANSLSSIVRFSIILVERQQTGYTTPEWQQTVINKCQNLGGEENLGGKYPTILALFS